MDNPNPVTTPLTDEELEEALVRDAPGTADLLMAYNTYADRYAVLASAEQPTSVIYSSNYSY